MLEVKTENNANDRDINIIEAFKQTIALYSDTKVEDLWEEVKSCNFREHHIGKGGNHIWISRKSDNERVAIIS